jgi:hypothetical protein
MKECDLNYAYCNAKGDVEEYNSIFIPNPFLIQVKYFLYYPPLIPLFFFPSFMR